MEVKYILILMILMPALVYSISVCPAGCDYTSISRAVERANPGDVITVQSGTYIEPPVLVNKTLSIIASGDVTVHPEKKDLFLIFGANDVEISGISIENGRSCFDILGSSRIKLKKIAIQNCTSSIHILDSETLEISSAVIKNSESGIEATNISDLAVLNSEFYGISVSPLYLSNATNSQLKNLKIFSSQDGIYILHSSAIKIADSSIDVARDGLTIDSSSDIAITNLKITSNIPLSILDSNSNTINASVFKTSGSNSILIQNSASNLIYGNDIYGDVIIYSSRPNFWNTSLGNYWNTYSGEDADGDGVIDKPYVLDANNIDYLPRVEPYVKEQPSAQPTPAAGGGGGAAPRRDPVEAYSQLSEELLAQIYEYFNIKGKRLHALDPAFGAAFLALDSDIYPATGYNNVDSRAGKNYGKLSKTEEYLLLSKKIKSSLLNSEYIVIARSDIPADAISAIAYSRARKIPLLIVETQSLPQEVEELIKALKPRRIIIIGGPVAISPEVEKKLKLYAPVVRIYGDTRVETSVRVAEMTAAVEKIEVVVIQDGWNIKPEASIIAALYRAPVIYTKHSQLTPEAVDFLKRHPGIRVVFAGVRPEAIDEVKKILGE